ncbi:MAG: hypothetical protein ACR2PI_19695 [Hyphomicrobiaceae bacterium]
MACRYSWLAMDILVKALIGIPTALVVGTVAADTVTALWVDTVQAALPAFGF